MIEHHIIPFQQVELTNEERNMTQKLVALAEKYQCSIVLVGHMNKAAGNKVARWGKVQSITIQEPLQLKMLIRREARITWNFATRI